jgi:hypothetical protein
MVKGKVSALSALAKHDAGLRWTGQAAKPNHRLRGIGYPQISPITQIICELFRHEPLERDFLMPFRRVGTCTSYPGYCTTGRIKMLRKFFDLAAMQ